MAIPLPVGFDDVMEAEGYTRTPIPNVLSSPVDVGEPKSRMRFSGIRRRVSFSRTVTHAEYVIFEDWFEGAANFGVTPIQMTDAVRSETGTFKFDPENPYNAPALSTNLLRLTINLVRIS